MIQTGIKEITPRPYWSAFYHLNSHWQSKKELGTFLSIDVEFCIYETEDWHEFRDGLIR